MAYAVNLLACLAFLRSASVAGAASECKDVFDCHLGEDIQQLKQAVNSKLGCNCVDDPRCTCVGLCSKAFCESARARLLIRAPDVGFCDAGLQTLKEAVTEQCIRPECCPGCDVAAIAETQRACFHPYSSLETTLSAVYAAVAAVAYMAHVTAPSRVYQTVTKKARTKIIDTFSEYKF